MLYEEVLNVAPQALGLGLGRLRYDTTVVLFYKDEEKGSP
jgi:hypothetical protein